MGRVARQLWWRPGHTPLLALLLIAAIGLPLRLVAIGAPFTGFHGWNEAHYAMIARNFALGGPFVQYDDLGLDGTTAPLVPWLIAAAQALFGPWEWAARLPILLCGLLTLWLFFLMGRRLYGAATALVALALAAVLPDVVYFSRNIQLDGPQLAAVLAAAVALLRYRQQGRPRHHALFLGSLTAAYLCKWQTPLFLPFLAALWLWRPPDGDLPRRFDARTVLLALAVPPLPALAWTWWGLQQAPSYERVLIAGYFERGNEFSGAALLAALAAAGQRLTANFSILLLLLFLGLPWLAVTWRRHLPILLLTASVLPELRYPISFRENIYYLYPALYGLALLCAAIGVAGARSPRSGRRSLIAMGAVALLVLGAGLAVHDYLHFIDLAAGRPDLVTLARTVRDERTGTDRTYVSGGGGGAPQLMYYAGGDPHTILAQTLSASCLPDEALLASRFYRFALYLAPPAGALQQHLLAWGYRPLRGGLIWRLGHEPARPAQAQPWLAAPRAVVARRCAWMAAAH